MKPTTLLRLVPRLEEPNLTRSEDVLDLPDLVSLDDVDLDFNAEETDEEGFYRLMVEGWE